MDFNDMEMTQVISVPEDSDDDMDREIRAVLKLHDQDAPAAFQTFNLKPGPNMVGRSRTCDVIIENYAVSKQHAVINVGGRSCTIMDLGSQNKVKIGKRTLKPNCQYNLDYGEEFTIAGLRARVLCDQNNGTNNDTGSDTCSESLLTAIEVALSLRGVLATARDRALHDLPNQGNVLACVAADWAGSHFTHTGAFTTFADGRFVYRARLNLLHLNSAAMWGPRDRDQRCCICGCPWLTLPHVYHCMPHNVQYHARHNTILNRTASRDFMVTFENRAVGDMGLYLDLVLVRSKEAIILYVTGLFEDTLDAFVTVAMPSSPTTNRWPLFSDVCIHASLSMPSSLVPSAPGTRPYLRLLKRLCDQEGVDIKTLAGSDTNEKLYLPSAASEHDVGAADAVATSVDVSDQQAAEKSQDSKTYRNEHQSSGSFNLPEMPNLDYTQTDSEQGTEPYMGAGHETERSQEGAGMVVQAAKVPASDDTPSAKDSRTCTSMQLYSDDAGEQNSRDTRKFAAADEESRLNAETQPYAECPEVSLLSSVGEGVDAAADEMERLNAPTQAYGDHESAEAERLNAPTQAYTDQDDVERLNAATQPYTANDSMDDEERLNAVTQPYATDKCDEEDKLNAVTQPYTRSVNDDEGRLNAVTQPYTTADVSQNEHERLNDITHSFNEEEDDMGKDSVCPPSQGVERHRRLLTGPSELSFVLCEASQPCQEEKEEEEDDDEFCAPTQKEESPPLKVHALLKHRRERGPAVEDDKTPPLSPKTTVDETPPASPGVVPESDPEDDGDTSMVTARHSLPLLDATSATVYEDCVTPGNGVSSPVIGIVSNRRQRRGLSLKKPTCDTVPELPSQDSPAGEDWMQQEQGSSQSKASRKLAYVTEEGKDNDLDSGAADAPLAEPLVSGVERTDGHFAASGSSPNIPVKPQESIDANKSTSAEYSEMPLLLHMSEDMDLDINATEKEDSTACDTSVEEKEPTKACESSEITATTGRPSDGRTVSKDGSKNEQEETFEKHDSANPSFENKKTSKASPREEGLADIQTVPEQACEEEEQAIENDESANDSSKSEVESGRATRKGGKKKPPARAKRCTRKAAFANDAKKPLWRTILCRHEGAAGVRMLA
ncbi:hypothetical protein HPB51_004885 [Rhipicephalus microplus]|uniref:FHA domain-containing protein n=1 Tax=Rhipicephalus microplus TaxID=6941 RepID=A0A9J6E6H6_RHIMP|nr:hypothetical protein HPB51_004885 [Rhipicephalus microplus]